MVRAMVFGVALLGLSLNAAATVLNEPLDQKIAGKICELKKGVLGNRLESFKLPLDKIDQLKTCMQGAPQNTKNALIKCAKFRLNQIFDEKHSVCKAYNSNAFREKLAACLFEQDISFGTDESGNPILAKLSELNPVEATGSEKVRYEISCGAECKYSIVFSANAPYTRYAKTSGFSGTIERVYLFCCDRGPIYTDDGVVPEACNKATRSKDDDSLKEQIKSSGPALLNLSPAARHAPDNCVK